MTRFRGFIAIDIRLTNKIQQLIKDIKESGANVKLVEPKNIHITLKFLGDTNESDIQKIEKFIEESIKGIEPFNIKLKNIGAFPNQNYMKVIWIGIENGDSIATIANEIDRKLNTIGFKKETRKFSPHLTIGRVKSAKNKEKLSQILNKYMDVEFAVISVDSIKLKQSVLTKQGPIYSTKVEVKL